MDVGAVRLANPRKTEFENQQVLADLGDSSGHPRVSQNRNLTADLGYLFGAVIPKTEICVICGTRLRSRWIRVRCRTVTKCYPNTADEVGDEVCNPL